MSGVGASQMILALQVGLGDLKIMQGHVGTFVAEQFHDGGQGDAGAQHLRGICVAHLVRDDAGADSGRRCDIPQGVAEFAGQHVSATRPRQKQTTGAGRIRWAHRTEPLYQLTDQGIHGNPAFGF